MEMYSDYDTVKESLNKLGLSVEAFATMLGMSKQAFYMYKKTKRIPPYIMFILELMSEKNLLIKKLDFYEKKDDIKASENVGEAQLDINNIFKKKADFLTEENKKLKDELSLKYKHIWALKNKIETLRKELRKSSNE